MKIWDKPVQNFKVDAFVFDGEEEVTLPGVFEREAPLRVGAVLDTVFCRHEHDRPFREVALHKQLTDGEVKFLD